MAATEVRFERVTNLVTFLLDRQEGATFAQILEEIPGWPPGDEARRRAFERDKRVLRDEGIPLIEDKGRYRIPPEQFYLPDLDLSAEEKVALRLAVAAVPGSSESGGALSKLFLGPVAGSDEPVPIVAALDDQPLLPTLHTAIRTRSPIRFVYEGGSETREIEPALLFFREGNWYVTGHDRARDAQRSFRITKIVGNIELLEAGGFEPPERPSDAPFPRQAWLLADETEPDEAIVTVDAVLAWKAVSDVGERGAVERHEDGSVSIRMPVTNREAFRTWVLGMLDHAVIVGPEHLRRDVIEWLEAMA